MEICIQVLSWWLMIQHRSLIQSLHFMDLWGLTLGLFWEIWFWPSFPKMDMLIKITIAWYVWDKIINIYIFIYHRLLIFSRFSVACRMIWSRNACKSKTTIGNSFNIHLFIASEALFSSFNSVLQSILGFEL